MMQFAVPVGNETNIHLFKSWTFILILIGMMLLTESAHLSNALSHVTPVPKGYLYFAISLIISRSTEYENE
jgi:hypothetical protein